MFDDSKKTEPRFSFCKLSGTILFSFSLFGKIIGLCMLINAGFNVYILVKYPGYDAAQRKDAQSEISDYLAANPAFAQHVVSMGVKATSDFVASNPGESMYFRLSSLAHSLAL